MAKKSKPSVSLLISTYNWPEALNLCLQGVVRQSVLPDEILIADDGSDQRTEDLIKSYQKKYPVVIRHFWHEDKGFRKTIVLNQAIVQAKGAYIVQLDGDMIPHKHYIKDHIDFAETGSFVRGTRIYINSKKTKKLLDIGFLPLSAWSSGIKARIKTFRVPLLWQVFKAKYNIKGDRIFVIYGANMAFWREDAIRVNGYNEDFEGWGPEDSEFATRLLNAGVRKHFFKHGGLAFHLHHEEISRACLVANQEILDRTISSQLKWCENGCLKPDENQKSKI